MMIRWSTNKLTFQWSCESCGSWQLSIVSSTLGTRDDSPPPPNQPCTDRWGPASWKAWRNWWPAMLKLPWVELEPNTPKTNRWMSRNTPFYVVLEMFGRKGFNYPVYSFVSSVFWPLPLTGACWASWCSQAQTPILETPHELKNMQKLLCDMPEIGDLVTFNNGLCHNF